MFENPLVFYGLIFAAALLIFDTILRLLFSSRRRAKEVKNRLESLKQKQGVETAYTDLLQRRGFSRSGTDSLFSRLNRFIGQTGLEISTARRLLYLVAFFVLGYFLAGYFLGLPTLARYFFGAIFSVVFALLILKVIRDRRIKRFTAQMAPAIDIIVRSLHAGHPLTSAIALVAREMPDPIGSEFGLLSDQMTFGSELEQGMLNMIDRVGAHELNLLAVTVSVQRGTGGNLSEILENLAQMIRDRLMIKAKIRAISAEGRATAWIMLIFPFFLFFMIRFLVPTYFDLVWESGYGTAVVVGCLTMIFFGMLIVRRLVNFDF